MAVAAQPTGSESALAAPLPRRSLALATAALSLLPLPAMADGNVVQFYGAANPPATYGGVGGTTRKFARYGFLIPDTFTEEAVSKVDKGSGGVDCRFATGTCYHQELALRVLTVSRRAHFLLRWAETRDRLCREPAQ
jgi:hypothetical protein